MKKRLLACVLTMILILMLLVGCIFGKEASAKTSNMFEYVGHSSEANCEIVYDTETKVMYAVFNYKYMIVLVDEDGKPKLWK